MASGTIFFGQEVHAPVNVAGQLLTDFVTQRVNATIGEGWPGPPGSTGWTGREAVTTMLHGQFGRATWSQATDQLSAIVGATGQYVDISAASRLGQAAAAGTWARESDGVPLPADHRAMVVGGQAVARGRGAPMPRATTFVGSQGGVAAAAPFASQVQVSARERLGPSVGGGQEVPPQFLPPPTVRLGPSLPALLPGQSFDAGAVGGQALQAAAATPLPASRPASPSPAPIVMDIFDELAGTCGEPADSRGQRAPTFGPGIGGTALPGSLPGVPVDIRLASPPLLVSGAPSVSAVSVPADTSAAAPGTVADLVLAASVGRGSAAAEPGEPQSQSAPNPWAGYQAGIVAGQSFAAGRPGGGNKIPPAASLAGSSADRIEPGRPVRNPQGRAPGKFAGFFLGQEAGMKVGPAPGQLRPVDYRSDKPVFIRPTVASDYPGYKVMVHDLPPTVTGDQVLEWVFDHPGLGRDWAVRANFRCDARSRASSGSAGRAIVTVDSPEAAYEFFDAAFGWWCKHPTDPRGWRWCSVRFFLP